MLLDRRHFGTLAVLAFVAACSGRSGPGTEEGGSAGTATSGGQTSTLGPGPATDSGATGSSSTALDTTGVGTTAAPVECGIEDADASLEIWESEFSSEAYWYVGLRRQLDPPLPVATCLYHTLIVVEDGVVVRGRLDPEPTGERECAAGWEELGNEIGTHEAPRDGLPAPAWTLDEVYGSCCDLLATPPDGWEPAFFANEDGLIHRCLVHLTRGGPAEEGPLAWGGEPIWIEQIGSGPPPE